MITKKLSRISIVLSLLFCAAPVQAMQRAKSYAPRVLLLSSATNTSVRVSSFRSVWAPSSVRFYSDKKKYEPAKDLTPEDIKHKFKVPIMGIGPIDSTVKELKNNNVHHIMAKKHAWTELVQSDDDWPAVASLVSKAMKEGEEMPHGSKAHTKRLQIDDKEVEVRFIRLENGTTRIGSAWIRTVKEK